jgi:hypothetical protein
MFPVKKKHSHKFSRIISSGKNFWAEGNAVEDAGEGKSKKRGIEGSGRKVLNNVGGGLG